MKHEGYTIRADKEQTLDHRLQKASVTYYSVLCGHKVVDAGLPSVASAKAAIARRRKLRQRVGLDPVG